MILKITDHDNSVRQVHLGDSTQDWLIGRAESNDIVLSAIAISRTHAKLSGGPKKFFIEDMNSRLGTVFNGAPLKCRMEFTPNDIVTIASFNLQICPAKKPQKIKPEASSYSFKECNLLYTDEMMELKKRIHAYILGKLNLSEIASKQLEDDEMRAKLVSALDSTLKELRHELPEELSLDALRQSLLDELTGFGPISPLLRASAVDEIMINGPDMIFVEAKGRIHETGVRFFNERHLQNIIQRIVEPLGRHVDEASPMVDARLPDGWITCKCNHSAIGS